MSAMAKKLTPKQEKFAQSVASGNTQADAYRASFECSKSTPESIQTLASRLMARVEVRLRVNELRDQLSAKALWTREDSVLTLTSVLNDPDVRSNDKISAVKVLNDMHGFNAPVKTEADNTVTIRIIE